MARDLDFDLDVPVIAPVLLVEIGTADPDQPILAWSGTGDAAWDGKVFKGVGVFGKVTPIEETGDLKAGGVTFELSGIKPDILSASLSQIRWGRPAKVWLALRQGNAFDGTPKQIFAGLTDVPE